MPELQSHSTFNLIDEPWILVKTLSQMIEELSLAALFERAHEIESLANESAQQDFALLRMCIAILQRSISPGLDEDDDPAEIWGRLWDKEYLPFDEIRSYLNEWHNRFDLFDDELPFMQVADLKSKIWDAGKLMFASDNKEELTPLRTEDRKASLTFAEAARWLVTVQAYDVAGPKSGAEGDPNLTKGKGYPGGVGWTGRLGGVYAEGNSFQETLLLNLVLCGAEYDELFSEHDVPVWERRQQSAFMSEREPSGSADLYTWQSRRVKLIPQDGYVGEVMLTVGDKIEKHNKHKEEPMSAWKKNKSEEKRLKIMPVYTPVLHRPDRAMWRGLDSILPRTTGVDNDETFIPGIVKWLGHLSSPNGGRRLPSSYALRLRAVGIEYASQFSAIAESLDDFVGINAFLLSSAGAEANQTVFECINATENAVKRLGQFASNLVLASGLKPAEAKTSRDDALQQAKKAVQTNAYFEIDGEFRAWLLRIDEESDLVECQGRWAKAARGIIKRLADGLLERASTTAIVGRQQKNGWMSAAVAQKIFYWGLQEALRPIERDEIKEREVVG